MTGLEQLAVFAAGIGAGAINAVVGSGTLITFPVLLAAGYPPVVANVSNTVGLVPGGFSGAFGYRRELAGQRARLLRLGTASVLGGVTGAVLLLTLPEGAFRAIVPVLIVLACVLVVIQPKLSARVAAEQGRPVHGGPLLLVGVYLTGVYGGYFGAAQGVLLIGLLGLYFHDGLQRINAAKNVLTPLVNLVAALLFVLTGKVAWLPALLIAAGSILGGLLGAGIGRRLRAPLLRAVVVLVGLVAIVQLVRG